MSSSLVNLIDVSSLNLWATLCSITLMCLKLTSLCLKLIFPIHCTTTSLFWYFQCPTALSQYDSQASLYLLIQQAQHSLLPLQTPWLFIWSPVPTFETSPPESYTDTSNLTDLALTLLSSPYRQRQGPTSPVCPISDKTITNSGVILYISLPLSYIQQVTKFELRHKIRSSKQTSMEKPSEYQKFHS